MKGTTWTIFNPRGGCWFLDQDGWCRVERDHGRENKPASCRLFPFNRVFRIADWLIVDYNSVICPLRSLPADVEGDALGLSGRVSHADIHAEISAIADPAVVGTPLKLDPTQSVNAFIEREQRVARQCFELAGAEDISDDDMLQALLKPGSDVTGIKESVSAALRALSLPDTPAGSQALKRHALLLTPSLRFNEFFGPRRYTTSSEPQNQLARMWWAWYGLIEGGESLAERPLSLQEITSTWGELAPIACLLARWPTKPYCEPGPIPLDGSSPWYDRILAVGHRLVQAESVTPSQRPSLGEQLEVALVGLEAHEKIALLRQLEPLLERLRFGKAAPPTRKRALRRKKRSS